MNLVFYRIYTPKKGNQKKTKNKKVREKRNEQTYLYNYESSKMC